MGVKNKKGYLPFQNLVILDCFCTGLLTKDEMRFSLWTIRWSWGFDDKANNRRQDWTRPKSNSEIAKDLYMDEAHLSRVIRSLIAKNIILKQDNSNTQQYQFNEHIERWKPCKDDEDKSQGKKNPGCKIYNKKLSIIQGKVAEFAIKNQVNANEDNGLPNPKETLKKNKYNQRYGDRQQNDENNAQKQFLKFVENELKYESTTK
jgi:hypothetical protein